MKHIYKKQACLSKGGWVDALPILQEKAHINDKYIVVP